MGNIVRPRRHASSSIPDPTGDALTHIATRLNQGLQCAWCAFPARPYGSVDIEANAAWVHHLPGLPLAWQWAIHTDCLPDFQKALDADDSQWVQRIRPYCVERSHYPGDAR